MQALSTKYLPRTNHRGSRIKATSASGLSVTVPYPHGKSGMECHWEAAKALAAKLSWEAGEYVGGGTRDGYVFIALEYRAGVPGERFSARLASSTIARRGSRGIRPAPGSRKRTAPNVARSRGCPA